MPPAVVLIGNLDGVHRGHQALLAQARAIADARQCGLSVLTFDPHPEEVIRGTPPPKLATIERRIELLREHGADEVMVQPFTSEFAGWSPEQFVEELLVKRLAACAVVVGQNFRFGAHRVGGLPELHALGKNHGFEVKAGEVVGDERGSFSSTRTRDAIARGDIAEATHVLGRPHSLSGTVVSGDRLGRTIGFPTANLGDVIEMLPPHGVYAVLADARHAVMNLGRRPTVDGTSLRIEVHVLDFDGDLYGQPMRVHLIARLREERKFAGLEELKAQIAVDVEAARACLRLLPAQEG